MEFSIGLIHLAPDPLSLSAEERQQLGDLSDDLLLAVPVPGEHLLQETFSLAAPLFDGGSALAAAHALLLAARHPLLLVMGAPPAREQLEEITALEPPAAGTGAVILATSTGEPPLPMFLHRCALRPLERLLGADPDAVRLPPGLGVKRRALE